MTYSLLYYPKCSTCVKGLALLEANGINPKLITYYTNHLSVEELANIAKMVGGAKNLIRTMTAKDKNIDIEMPEADLIKAMIGDVSLIQRPVLIKGDKAIIGRPIEEMLKLC